jgi:hypothetical protein
MRATAVLFALLLGLAACAAHRAPAPAPALDAVVLLPIADPPNRSAVTGVFTFYSWIADTRAAVPAELAAAVRTRLAARGIAVLEPTGAAALPAASPAAAREAVRSSRLDAPALYIAIDKWEAQNTDFPAFVDIALHAELIEPDSGHCLWTFRRAAGPVATRAASGLAMAYQRAADTAAAWLVGGMAQ